MAQSVLSNHVTSAEQVNVESKTNYRAEIDGLRALAVLSVVIFHAFPAALTGGFVGVDIFFVISGFLITRHIFENFDQGRFSLVDFFSRRIRRIFPALIFVMVCSLAFGWFSLLNDEYAQLGKHVASGAAFMLNFILVGESGYFDNIAVTKPMLHLWSLAIEEQFYIVWPLIILVAWKFQFNLFKVILLAIFLSFSFNLLFVHSKPTHIFFSPFGRFWELLSGSLLAWLLHYKSTLVTRTTFWLDKKIAGLWSVQSTELQVHHSIFTSANIVSLLGAVLLLYGVIHIDKSFPFPSTWALLPVLGTVFIILSGSTAWFSRIFLMNPIMVWFGLISYSLYLWHWPILSFLHIMEGGVPQQDLRTLAVCVSILCAWLTYQFVEKPLRFGLHRKAKTVLLIFGWSLVGQEGCMCFITMV